MKTAKTMLALATLIVLPFGVLAASETSPMTGSVMTCGDEVATATSSSATSVDTTCGDCCPYFDPDVDCWAEGHWHYNHCLTACTP